MAKTGDAVAKTGDAVAKTGDAGMPERLHHMIMEIIRASGALQPEAAVPGHPLSLSQAFALHELDTTTALSQRDLAERLRLEKSTVSRMAADLEQHGLLVRERDPANRRLYRLRLTDAGRELHGRLGTAFHDRYVRWVAAMTAAEREHLLSGLTGLVRVIRAETDAPTGRP